MPLKLNLRAGERIVINGVLIGVEQATELIFHGHASIMTERQIIRPEEANTPARRIYYAIQNAYVSNEDERPGWMEQSYKFLDEYRNATTLSSNHQKIDEIRDHLSRLEYYPALRSTRTLFAHDDEMILPEPTKKD